MRFGGLLTFYTMVPNCVERHLLRSATRADAYTAVDEALKGRLSAAEYARYEGESQRPVFQRQVLAATMAGADLDQVLEVATGREFTGARSIAAVMHGRVKAAGSTRPAAARPSPGPNGSPR
jgi:hypothetical protein